MWVVVLFFKYRKFFYKYDQIRLMQGNIFGIKLGMYYVSLIYSNLVIIISEL